jgi:hypothetical protein
MLDEYVRGFKSRNPNLKIFQAIMHLDEASPHLHINFIPFYTKGRKNGLSKGVSMKAALAEQGFTNSSKKQNSLVAWEESELKVMEQILNRHGLGRDVKNATHEHMTLPEYKKTQDEKKLTAVKWTREPPEKLQLENALLRVERANLIAEKHSEWMAFYYSDEAKQSYIVAELDRLRIPYRLTENGFDSQLCYVDEIRKLEKSYNAPSKSHRDTLRDLLDKVVMQSASFDEVLERLRDNDCEVKCGKYLAVKPQYATNFIRTHRLGGEYSEQALKNRLLYKARFEQDVDAKIAAAVPESAEFLVQKTIRHYTIVFASGVLPVRKRDKKRAFSWENCEELDKLSALNKKLNEGVTPTSLRNEAARLEQSVTELEETLERFKARANPDEWTVAEIEKGLSEDRAKLCDTVALLDTLEKVVGKTLVQGLINEQRRRTQSDFIPNGLMAAESSQSDFERIEKLSMKALGLTKEDVEPIRYNSGRKK